MGKIEVFFAILNIITLVLIPLVAVIVGQKLQSRSEKRKDKLTIFKVLMANRFGWSPESVYALNIIDIVFADDKSVRNSWKEYYEKLCIQKPNEMQQKQIKTAQEKLLESIANSLGYKDQITWETIQNPYIPQGMIDAAQQQQTIIKGQESIATLISSAIKNPNETTPSPKEKDD